MWARPAGGREPLGGKAKRAKPCARTLPADLFQCPSVLLPSQKRLRNISSKIIMATKFAVRYLSRRLSSSGKVLSEEEKAAENVYIKKMEQEKLQKLARKGPQPEENLGMGSGGSVSDPKPSGSDSSASNVSSDQYRNYAVLAGAITAVAALGWYFKSSSKKPEEVQD
ncbi:hypothetical protein Nepgr_014015 [Nepenthes gracilis]|uniref:Uncharacterized protein n=1 Tax=Nepenthes gracilis TaxID=150966 RepID=A0AAD3SJZ5_NEPGR|nr:hypothetical protein Nepgr_014015 [Nepenthes gracilis]